MVLNRDLISICLFSACILVIPVTSRAGDWAQWGGTNNRNMVSKEKGLPDDFEADKEKALRQGAEKARNVKWVVRLGAFAYGNPTAVGGKVFAGTNVQTLSDDSRFKFKKGGLVKCLDAATGALVWQ